MRSIPVIIVVILIAAGGVFFIMNRPERQEVQNLPPEAKVPNADMLETENGRDLTEREVRFLDGRREFFVEPQEAGEYPGVVMIHEWWGLNEHIKDMARELAGQGYKVLAVDLYKGKVATTTADAQKYRMSASSEETTRILREAAAFLREQEATKVASLGWCYGGGKSLELALSGESLDATVIYYGQLETSPEKLSAIKWPVLGIFGDKDQSIPVSTVQAFDAALDTAGVENEIHIYKGVGHAFANPSGQNYAPEETKDAWQKTLSFLADHLK